MEEHRHDQPVFSCIQILYSTQTGRAKACARRTARILREHQASLFGSSNNHGSSSANNGLVSVPMHQSIDQYQLYQKLVLRQQQQQQQKPNNQDGEDNTDPHPNGMPKTLYLFFISTTGEGEHCDSVQQTWKALLNKSLNSTNDATTNSFASSVWFGLFCLGDRAYGDLFCAAGRKWAVRLLQLGATLYIPTIGYGDDSDGDAGVFSELDVWLQTALLPHVVDPVKNGKSDHGSSGADSLTPARALSETQPPYQLQIDITSSRPAVAKNGPSQNYEEWRDARFADAYRAFFSQTMCPVTAYHYSLHRDDNNSKDGVRRRRYRQEQTTLNVDTRSASICDAEPPLIGKVVFNQRITAVDWTQQDTRHIGIRIESSNNLHLPSSNKSPPTDLQSEDFTLSVELLPYRAGDIATIIPRNSDEEVVAFLQVLPTSIQDMAGAILNISQPSSSTTTKDASDYYAGDTSTAMTVSWPEKCTLRGWLTYCADIHSLPEREDLRALSVFCSPLHPHGRDQHDKLVSLSEPSDSALYVDYIIREKRTWKDVFFDFDSIRCDQPRLMHADSTHQQQAQDPPQTRRILTLLDLFTILPPMRPRDFSLASAPSWTNSSTADNPMSCRKSADHWDIELCVGVVQGTTRLGRRHFHGLCSTYLGDLRPSQLVQLWIRPGSFGALPLEPQAGAVKTFETPILCIGAGTGIAPMRSLLLERDAVRRSRCFPQALATKAELSIELSSLRGDTYADALIFGCRKANADFYFQDDWVRLSEGHIFKLWTSFSQDQRHKVYVQQALRQINDQNEFSLVQHVVERLGGIFIAGNPKMARAVKDEIKTIIAEEIGEKGATRCLKELQRMGRFSVEAWS